MTEQEMRIAVAESVGIKCLHCQNTGIKVEASFSDQTEKVESTCRHTYLPNYPRDLNAIREAWATLSDAEKRKFYSILSNLPGMCRLVSKNVLSQDYLVIGATAFQWTGAYLRLKGLYKDET